MNKDNKNERSFPERFKKWLKFERKNPSGAREFRVSDEVKVELGSESSSVNRLRAIKDLTEILSTQKLEEVSLK